MKAEDFLSAEEHQSLEKAIEGAELNTSGEIRVHIEDNCKGDVLDRAAFVFKHLKMHKTALRNGVLFYLSVKDKKFAILGDAGINAKVSADFWDEVKNEVIRDFKDSKFSEGLSKGIHLAGIKLKEHFPFQSNDKNELSNEITFG
jgi:uncharacterized membrane protein